MSVKVSIAAENFGEGQKVKGDITSILPEGSDWGTGYVLPRYIKLNVTDVVRDQVVHFTQQWKIDYLFTLVNQNDSGWRYKVEVDANYISASDVGKNQIKQEMRDYIENPPPDSLWSGCSVVNFGTNRITADIPKNGDYQTSKGWADIEYLQELKYDFTDKFKTVLNIRRYYFDEATIDSWISQGGDITLTKSETLGLIRDKLDD